MNMNPLKEISENAFVDSNFHHNQAIDVIEYAIKNNFFNINDKPILINLDAHSDIYVNTVNTDVTRGNWVNYLIHKYNFTEIYWVIPNYIVEGKNPFSIPQDINNCCLTRDDCPIDIKNSPTQILYYNYKTMELHTKAKIEYVNKNCIDFNMEKLYDTTFMKMIELHRVKIENLPNFKNKNVFLTIDGDYYSNCGFQTINNLSTINSTINLEKQFLNDINTLVEKDVVPKLISMCISPQFVCAKDIETLKKIFVQIVENSKNKELCIKEYKYFSL